MSKIASMSYEDYVSLMNTRNQGAKYIVSLRHDENFNYFLDVSSINDLNVEKVGENVIIKDFNDGSVFVNSESISPMGRPIALDGNFRVIPYETSINYGEINSYNGILRTYIGSQELKLDEEGIKRRLQTKGVSLDEIYKNQKEDSIDLSHSTISEDDLNSILRASFMSGGKYVIGLRRSKQITSDNLNGTNKKLESPWIVDIISIDDLKYKEVNGGLVLYAGTDNAFLNPNRKFSGLCQPLVLDANFNIVGNGLNSTLTKNSDGSFSFSSSYNDKPITIDTLKRMLETRESLEAQSNKIEFENG